MTLRAHQSEMRRICQAIRLGEWPSNGERPLILSNTVTAGGKSALPVIAAAELIPAKADRILVVVPRTALQEQAEAAFQASWLRSELGHQMEIRASTNEVNPSRDKVGYVTTYQAIAANPGLHHAELRRHRYILVLDEAHHIEEGGTTHRALEPLFDLAAVVIVQTGTLERSTGKPIAFIPYEQSEDGLTVPVGRSGNVWSIRYTRPVALAERAIIPLQATLIDGRFGWGSETGAQIAIQSFNEAGKQINAAIWTALRTDYAEQLLAECVGSWREARALNPRAKLLVIAPTQVLAREYRDELTAMGVRRVGVATQDEGPDAQKTIRRYKRSAGDPAALDALVTVMMAYEGLDVPSITHIAFLSHIRFAGWIDQALGRGIRVDPDAGPWESQLCQVFAPNDELFTQTVARIYAEQDPVLREMRALRERGERSPDASGQDYIIPLSGEATDRRAIDPNSGVEVDPERYTLIEQARTKLGIRGASVLQLAGFLQAMAAPVPTATATVSRGSVDMVPPREREQRIRQAIEKHARRWAMSNGHEFRTLNSELYSHFGKSRADMTESELMQCWAYVQRRYPLGAN